MNLFGTTGVVNNVLQNFGMKPVRFLTTAVYFKPIYIGMSIWQGFGWSSIIYLAAIASVDPTLYEASYIDGAGRFRQIWHVTLPGMTPTITILLVLSIGSLLSADTEKILLLSNPTLYESSDVFGTYVYREGLVSGRFSYATAVGLLATSINFILLTIANRLSRKVNDFSLW